MATDTTSCPRRQNQTTFGSFAACTLPIAGDFGYIYFRSSVNRPVAQCHRTIHDAMDKQLIDTHARLRVDDRFNSEDYLQGVFTIDIK